VSRPAASEAIGGGNRLEVGRVGRAHGLRGEVAVRLTTDRLERVEPGAVLFVDDRALVVAGARRHRGRWLVRFEDVADRAAAEALTGATLRADVLASAPGELWVHELVGRPVHDRSTGPLGTVVAVQANPAHDLLVLDGGALVPVVFVTDAGGDAILVDVPAGLLDL
jgi:16S rRNA processing protein RimM